jgi:hypothetical protein
LVAPRPTIIFSQSGFFDQRGLEGRGRPLSGIGLFHVIHEVESKGPRRARVQGGENPGLAVARDFPNLIESGIAQESHGEFATLGHAAIFGGDGGLPDPLLQPVHGFVVMLVDLGMNRSQLGIVRAARLSRRGQCGNPRNSPLKKRPPVK